MSFFIDAARTFAHFALSPLQWLFLRFPRIYEVIITTIIFWKNTLPTRREITHTLYHWQYLLLSGSLMCCKSIVNYMLSMCSTLLNLINKNLQATRDLK